MKIFGKSRKYTMDRHCFLINGIIECCKAKFGKAYRRWKHRNVEEH